MKKLLFYAALFIGISAIVLSCSKDNYQTTLEGKWAVIEYNGNVINEKEDQIINQYFEFRESGLFIQYVNESNGIFNNGTLQTYIGKDFVVNYRGKYFVTEDLLSLPFATSSGPFGNIAYAYMNINIINRDRIELVLNNGGDGLILLRIKNISSETKPI